MWTPDYTYAQFQVTCIVKKVDIHMVKRIGSTIIALRLHKNAFDMDESKRVGASAELEKLAFQNSAKRVMVISSSWIERIYTGG